MSAFALNKNKKHYLLLLIKRFKLLKNEEAHSLLEHAQISVNEEVSSHEWNDDTIYEHENKNGHLIPRIVHNII